MHSLLWFLLPAPPTQRTESSTQPKTNVPPPLLRVTTVLQNYTLFFLQRNYISRLPTPVFPGIFILEDNPLPFTGIYHGETFLSWSLVVGVRVFLPVTAILQRKAPFGLSFSLSALQINQPLLPQLLAQLRGTGVRESPWRGALPNLQLQSVAAAVHTRLPGRPTGLVLPGHLV